MVLADTSYTSQPDRSSFTYTFNLPQLKGGIGQITVDAQCNKFGSRSGTLMLTRMQVPPGTVVSSSPNSRHFNPQKQGHFRLLLSLR
jgi:hypothetical protein